MQLKVRSSHSNVVPWSFYSAIEHNCTVFEEEGALFFLLGLSFIIFY